MTESYRHLDNTDLKLIGKGSTASVYRLDDDRILKVYDSERYRRRLDFVQMEAEVSREVFNSGLPCANSHEIVYYGDFYACIYDYIGGEALGDVILREPDRLEFWIEKMAELACRIHKTAAPSDVFPKVRMISKLYPYMKPWLNEEQMAKYTALAETVPDTGFMIHTDFHFDNVLVKDGELQLIDVGGMSHGHPVYDLLSLYRRARFPHETRTKLPPSMNEQVYDTFLNCCFESSCDVLERCVALLTEFIRVSVPCAKGAPETFSEEDRIHRYQLLDKLLARDVSEEAKAFDELAKWWVKNEK